MAKTMKFWQAMKLVEEGHRVRRNSWGANWCTYFDKEWGEVVETNGQIGNTNTAEFDGSDVNATDWIIFE